jgi:putative ABC transport system permease protein
MGVFLACLFIALAKLRLPEYASLITFQSLGVAFGMVLVIIAVSSYIAIRKVTKIDPFDIFRG